MIDFKSVFASKTLAVNAVIAVVGAATAFGALPAGCSAELVAGNLGVTVPTLLGSALTGLAVLSSFFRIKATTVLI